MKKTRSQLFKQAEKDARTIARIFGVTKPPFNINLLFHHFKDITLELRDLKNQVFGYNYERYDGTKVIVVNENLSYQQKRAALLHEFAHIYNHQPMCDSRAVHPLGEPRPLEEHAADQFSEALAMPAPLFKKYWKKHQDTGLMAILFEVTEGAVRRRLNTLELH